jgi:hypothetical protein
MERFNCLIIEKESTKYYDISNDQIQQTSQMAYLRKKPYLHEVNIPSNFLTLVYHILTLNLILPP